MSIQKLIAAELVLAGVIAGVVLGFGIQGAGLASGLVDPILQAGAQDEAVYGHAAARMVRTGDWLTPVFLDRYMLNKPPLLFWAGALSMRLAGFGALALRAPILAAGILCCMLVYWWVRRSRSAAAALAGVILLLGSPTFHDMNRRFMTDALLTLLIVAALALVFLDPRWERRATAFAFGALSGAAILTKSAAGLLPLVILAVYWILAGQERPPVSRVLLAFGIAALVAAPWHIYQLIAHKDWFVAEYIKFQLLGSGVTAPSRYNGDTNLWFYTQALLLIDPILLFFWVASIPWVALAWKRANSAEARLLAAWCIATAGCLILFGTRAAYYLLPLLPALALISAMFSPLLRGRAAIVTCGALMAVFGMKVWVANPPWGIDYRAATAPSAQALEEYAGLRRSNELIVVAPDDEFYASDLDLPKVRYVYLTRLDPSKTSAFFFRLGMILTSDEYCSLAGLFPEYERRLRAWNLPRDLHPEGTIIGARSNAQLPAIIGCSAGSDFLIPEELRALATSPIDSTHVATATRLGRFFLLSKSALSRAAGDVAPGTVVTLRQPD